MLSIEEKRFRIAENMRRWRAKPENKKRESERRQWQWKNDPTFRLKQRRYYGITNQNRKKKPYHLWARSTRSHHRGRGYKLLFTFEELVGLAKRTDICSVCYTIFDWNHYNNGGRLHAERPTLDRKNGGKILKLEDVWIICMRCNSRKNDMPMNEFVEYCKSIADNFGGDDLANG